MNRVSRLDSTRLTGRVIWSLRGDPWTRRYAAWPLQPCFHPLHTPAKERIMTATTTKPAVATPTHPACEHHHLAAARHVAAAYHHLQAIDQHNDCHHDVAKTHAETAQSDSAAAQKHSMAAASQSKK
jgi:hypothetical protein